MDGQVIVSNRTLHRVSLAVLLIDELTGRAITGSNARAWIENEKPPVKKGDGWFIFTELPPKKHTVLAEGGHYQRQSAECFTDGEGLPTLRLCLKPAKTYPLPSGCLRVEGSAEPNAVVTAYIPSKKNAFNLLADAKQGSDTLTVFHSDGVNLEGCAFRIIASNGEEESVFVRAKTGENAYRLTAPLLNVYQRIGTMLVPASETSADGNGSFFMALRCGLGDSGIVFEAKGSKHVRKEYKYQCGDGNCICPVLDK